MNNRPSTVGTAVFMVGIVVVLAGLAYYLVMSVPGPDVAPTAQAGTSAQTDQGGISATYPDAGNMSSGGSYATSTATSTGGNGATSTGTSTSITN